ncbi:MAG: CDP-glycerol glycerophosphotransferase family protein [Demequina sp.]|uniref:CDP-glycerol glycerophosphotransferase family protein n=1 Tax=Demequina sp. TaxID=2050685 RepID=UPI003A8523EB
MLSTLKGLIKPRRLVALALAGLVAVAVALEASWLVPVVIALVVALIVVPLNQRVGPTMKARLPSAGYLARFVAGAGRSAAAIWLSLGALGTYAALREDGRDWAVGLVFLIGAGSTAMSTLASRPALRGDLRLSTIAQAQARTIPWAIASVYLAAILTLPALALWPGVVATTLSVLAAILAFAGIAMVLRRITMRGRIREQVLGQISELEPAFVVYQSGPYGSAYQLKMWLPFLEEAGLPYVVVARQEALFTELRSITDRPVIYAGSLRAVDEVLAHCGGTVIYVNNAAANTHAVRRYQLHHVQILHGDSDKASSRNPISAMYDELWVAGQAAIDRYWDHGIGIPAERFRIVGRPQVSGIEGPREAVEGGKVALYAPTWNGFFGDANYSSLPHGVEIVQALLDEGLTVIFREHPYSSKSAALRAAIAEIHALLAEDARATGRQHRYGPTLFEELDLIGCFNACDMAVTDISAVTNDFLFSGKPFAIMEMQPDTLVRAEGRPTLASAAYTAVPGDDVASWIGELVHDHGKADAREAAREHYLGAFDREGYTDVFVNAVRDTVATHRLEGELDTE